MVENDSKPELSVEASWWLSHVDPTQSLKIPKPGAMVTKAGWVNKGKFGIVVSTETPPISHDAETSVTKCLVLWTVTPDHNGAWKRK